MKKAALENREDRWENERQIIQKKKKYKKVWKKYMPHTSRKGFPKLSEILVGLKSAIKL